MISSLGLIAWLAFAAGVRAAEISSSICGKAATKKSCSSLSCAWCDIYCSSNCAESWPGMTGLPLEIYSIVNRPEFDGCKWGIQALNTTNSALIYENAGAHLFSVPASNGKLPSSFAAWLSLGPDYIFTTSVGVGSANSPKSSDSSSTARVTLCGSNDPSITTDSLSIAAAHAFVSSPMLATADVIQIRIDNRRGADTLFPDTWEWGDLIYDYGAPPSSVIVDGNVVVVSVAPSKEAGLTASVTLANEADSLCFNIVNNVMTTSTDSQSSGVDHSFQAKAGVFSLLLEGSVAVNSGAVSIAVACVDPLARAAAILAAAVSDAAKSNGSAAVVSVAPDAVLSDAPECDEANLPAAAASTISSPRLDVLLNHTLLVSDNTYAEAIFRRQGSDGSYAASMAAVRSTLSTLESLDMTAYSSVDGSGLSRHNLVTPAFLSHMLTHADEAYIKLLPLAGRTGTLANRFIGTPAEGILYAKTGSMTNVNALSGRVNDVTFSILSDSCPVAASEVRQGIDDIAVLFAQL